MSCAGTVPGVFDSRHARRRHRVREGRFGPCRRADQRRPFGRASSTRSPAPSGACPQTGRARRSSATGSTGTTSKRPGLSDASALAAVTSGDNSNILCARIARETYEIPHVVARIYDPRRAEIFQRLGIPTVPTVAWTIDHVLRRMLPERCITLWSELDRPAAPGRTALAQGVGGAPPAARGAARRRDPGRRGDRARACPRSTSKTSIAQEGDVLSLIVTYEIESQSWRRCSRACRSCRDRGTGRTTDESGESRVRARWAGFLPRTWPRTATTCSCSIRTPSSSPPCRRIEGVRYILADACEVTSLKAAHFDEMDVVVATTGDDEDNLVISQLAKQEFAVPRVLATGEPPEEPLALQRDVGRGRGRLDASAARRPRRGGGVGRDARPPAAVRRRPHPAHGGDAGRELARRRDRVRRRRAAPGRRGRGPRAGGPRRRAAIGLALGRRRRSRAARQRPVRRRRDPGSILLQGS